ncbi:hypothetical protein AOQ84DRAFT_223657 [Glonium stellatum]|uniref:Uncharacterized protein n=1 Tax=Glonium stellatum TaxID=574774 RepID=A0A8E2EYB9_9PEZI|nr:hypothetical protein AOQ84DRAFT_223657 [Glonium stellatum]
MLKRESQPGSRQTLAELRALATRIVTSKARRRRAGPASRKAEAMLRMVVRGDERRREATRGGEHREVPSMRARKCGETVGGVCSAPQRTAARRSASQQSVYHMHRVPCLWPLAAAVLFKWSTGQKDGGSKVSVSDEASIELALSSPRSSRRQTRSDLGVRPHLDRLLQRRVESLLVRKGFSTAGPSVVPAPSK